MSVQASTDIDVVTVPKIKYDPRAIATLYAAHRLQGGGMCKISSTRIVKSNTRHTGTTLVSMTAFNKAVALPITVTMADKCTIHNVNVQN